MLITVMGPAGQAGKTTTALALCKAAVLGGKKALAVELDFSPGSFKAYFDLGQKGGLVSAVNRSGELREVVAPTRLGFDVLQGGFPEEEEIVAGEPLVALLKNAQGIYDLVVVDTAGKVSPASVDAARMSDLVVVVVPGGRGEEGIRRTYAWIDWALLNKVISPNKAVAVTNHVPKKLMWLTKKTVGTKLPIAVELPEIKTPLVGDFRLAREFLPMLGLTEVGEKPGLFQALRRRLSAGGRLA